MSKPNEKKKPRNPKPAKPVVLNVEPAETPVADTPEDKITLYVWLDLRIETSAYKWRCAAVFNDQTHVGRNGARSRKDAIEIAADTLDRLSGWRLNRSDVYVSLTERTLNDKIVVIDGTPPEPIWTEAEAVLAKLNGDKKADPAKLVAGIDEIIANASRTSGRAAEMGGFADAAAIDELIARAELGKLAIQRLATNPSRHRMRDMMMMMPPPWAGRGPWADRW